MPAAVDHLRPRGVLANPCAKGGRGARQGRLRNPASMQTV